MTYTPHDIIEYIIENELEPAFIASVMMHKGGYSIAEITDKNFRVNDKRCRLISETYSIKTDIDDVEICTALRNGLYITPFISRFNDVYNIHFLVHQYPQNLKSNFEEEITHEVIRYMILRTIKALRLDTPEKVMNYIK